MGIKNRHWLSLAAAALALQAAPIRAAGPVVPTIAAQPAAERGVFELEASVQALRQATVAAQTGGNLLALNVKAGDRVKAGQVLARIDDREAAAGLSSTEGGVVQAEAQLRNAKVSMERTRELRAQGFVSQAALDTAETQWRAAQAGLQQAQGARGQAVVMRGHATLTAPFDGIVLATHLEAGDLATPGRPVLTLYAPGALRAVAQVPSSRVAQARASRSTQVALPGSPARWISPVRQIELPTTDPVSQTVEWRMDLPADVTGLAPGQSLRVRFDGATAAPATPPSNALAIPPSAVLTRGELTAVFVAQGDRFVLRAVRLGAGGDRVLAGLQAGERVAVDAVRAGLADASPAPAGK